MNLADVVMVLLLLAAAASGYRRGLVTAALSLVGAVAGVLLAIRLAPLAVAAVSDSTARMALTIGLMVLGVGLGEMVGQWLGTLVTRRITWRPAMAVDRGLGLLGQMVATLMVAWLVALPLASLPVPWLASQVRQSAVLGAVDSAMPRAADDVSGRLRRMLSGFPQILAPLAPAPDTPVDRPDAGVVEAPAVAATRPSILKVRAFAPQCSQAMEGTGFVIPGGPDGGSGGGGSGADGAAAGGAVAGGGAGDGRLVVTNAHVVAGARSVTVGGARARVVAFNSDVDIAVVEVPGLTAPPLSFASDVATSGDDAVAAGYPLDGPFTLSPMRLRSRLSLTGPDITGSHTVTREVYTLRGVIRPGNSGGPLLTPSGAVLGVVFAAAVDKPDVAFALTRDEVWPVITAARRAVGGEGVTAPPVPTGACLVE